MKHSSSIRTHGNSSASALAMPVPLPLPLPPFNDRQRELPNPKRSHSRLPLLAPRREVPVDKRGAARWAILHTQPNARPG